MIPKISDSFAYCKGGEQRGLNPHENSNTFDFGEKEYFIIETYVIFTEKAIAAIFILIKVHFGGLRAPYLQTP